MRAFAGSKYDLVIGIGFAQTPIVEAVAKEYPKINFAIVDGVSDLPNVASLVFKEHQGSYLVGMIAAHKSRTGVLGFIGGMDIPLIHKFEVGYEEGARSVNPKIEVVQNYVRSPSRRGTTPARGRSSPSPRSAGRPLRRRRQPGSSAPSTPSRTANSSSASTPTRTG